MIMSQASHRDQKILVVDDDESHRLLARNALEDSAFIVEEAADGKEGLEAVKRFRPDLVLLDVMMPELDGVSVCTELRSHPDFMDLPILMVTGLDDIDSIERAFNAGATDFVTKPINWPLLVYHVKYVLRSSQLEQELQHTKNLLKMAGVPA